MKTVKLVMVLVVLGLLIGCSGKPAFHKTPMPDPKTFNGHFGDMDTGGDEWVDWKEFKAYFPQATDAVFKAIDLNGDTYIDHDEWHAFKEAHGLKDHD